MARQTLIDSIEFLEDKDFRCISGFSTHIYLDRRLPLRKTDQLDLIKVRRGKARLRVVATDKHAPDDPPP